MRCPMLTGWFLFFLLWYFLGIPLGPVLRGNLDFQLQ